MYKEEIIRGGPENMVGHDFAIKQQQLHGMSREAATFSLWKEEKDNKMSINRKFTETVFRSVDSTPSVGQYVF